MSSANSTGVQLDDQNSSTSTNIEVSSAEVFNTEITEDPCTITPKRKRRKHYVGDVTTPDLSTPQRAKFHYTNAKLKILSSRIKIEVLNQKINRLNKRLTSMAALLAHLKSKNLITEEAQDTISVITKEHLYCKCISDFEY